MEHEISNIAVLGISGRTGYHLGKQLLEKGFRVKALVRDRSKVKVEHEKLEIFEGSLFDENNLAKLIENVDAVISVLGYSKNSPPFFQTDFLKKIIPLMEKSRCKRIIVLTGSGVPFQKDKNTIGNFIISKLIFWLSKIRFLDGVYQLAELEKSSLEWTVFRCPLLTNSFKIARKAYVGNRAPGFFNTISRSTVSKLIINELDRKLHLRRALFAY